MSGYEEDAHAHHGHPGAPLAFLVLALFAGIFARTLLPKKLPYTVWLLGLGVVAGVVWDHEDAKTAHLGKVERMVRSWDVVDPHLILYGFLPALAGAGQARERPTSSSTRFGGFLDERSSLGAPSERGCVLWNARARHAHVEATSHRPCPAQVLIFESAFNTDFHTLFNELGQILVLAVPGVVLGTAATACCARAIYLDGAGAPRLPWAFVVSGGLRVCGATFGPTPPAPDVPAAKAAFVKWMKVQTGCAAISAYFLLYMQPVALEPLACLCLLAASAITAAAGHHTARCGDDALSTMYQLYALCCTVLIFVLTYAVMMPCFKAFVDHRPRRRVPARRARPRDPPPAQTTAAGCSATTTSWRPSSAWSTGWSPSRRRRPSTPTARPSTRSWTRRRPRRRRPKGP